MIRVREFADKVGCTPQNIYQHLKTYVKELEGHTQQGRRGIMLDEYAEDFLRSIMYPKEISADTEVMEELNRLRGELLRLGMKNTELASRLAQMETERDKAILEVSHNQRQLMALKESNEEQEAMLDQVKKEADAAEKLAADLQDQMEASLEKADALAQQLRADLEAACIRAAEAERNNRELKERGWLARLLRKGE